MQTPCHRCTIASVQALYPRLAIAFWKHVVLVGLNTFISVQISLHPTSEWLTMTQIIAFCFGSEVVMGTHLGVLFIREMFGWSIV